MTAAQPAGFPVDPAAPAPERFVAQPVDPLFAVGLAADAARPPAAGPAPVSAFDVAGMSVAGELYHACRLLLAHQPGARIAAHRAMKRAEASAAEECERILTEPLVPLP